MWNLLFYFLLYSLYIKVSVDIKKEKHKKDQQQWFWNKWINQITHGDKKATLLKP